MCLMQVSHAIHGNSSITHIGRIMPGRHQGPQITTSNLTLLSSSRALSITGSGFGISMNDIRVYLTVVGGSIPLAYCSYATENQVLAVITGLDDANAGAVCHIL